MANILSALRPEYHCPAWPACQCPDGTLATDCPGRLLPASSGSGGTASAPENMASPAAQAIDPDEVTEDLRALLMKVPAWRAWAEDEARLDAAMAEDEARLDAAMAARRGRTISGETLIRDINALLNRGDKTILELSAIQCELGMIRKDLGQLHGLPID